MKALISAGFANTTEARSPCMPAPTTTGLPRWGPSLLESVLKRRLNSQTFSVLPFAPRFASPAASALSDNSPNARARPAAKRIRLGTSGAVFEAEPRVIGPALGPLSLENGEAAGRAPRQPIADDLRTATLQEFEGRL